MSKQGVRVLVVGARGIPGAEGGAEKNAEALFPRMAAAGYDVTLVGLSSHIHGDQYRGVKLRKAPSVRVVKTDKLAYYLYAVWIAFRTRPEVVHLQGLGSALFLVFYRMAGARTIVRYGSADYEVGKWGVIGRTGFRLAEYQLRFASAVVSVAPALSERLKRKRIGTPIFLIPNAVDDEVDVSASTTEAASLDGLDVPFGRPFLLAVCRVTAQKNLEAVIDAYRNFANSRPEYQLVIAGGLDELAYVDSLRSRAGPGVTFLGRVPRDAIPLLLKRCAIYVNLSHHEGSSNATLEAISQGCPIVLSDIAENRNMSLADHFYVDRSDVAAISERFEDAAREPERFVAPAEQFMTWEEVAGKTMAVYDFVLGAKVIKPGLEGSPV